MLIAQRDAFLCAARGVSLGIAFQRRLGTGFFGGEGFIMEKLDGDGMVFVHAGGTILERQLAPGEALRVDTGCVVAYQPSVDFDVQYVGKIKTALFGGEGLFFATLRGPGHVWLQSLPFSRLASRVFAAAPQGGGRGRDEGGFASLVGATAVGGLLGGFLGGDDDAQLGGPIAFERAHPDRIVERGVDLFDLFAVSTRPKKRDADHSEAASLSQFVRENSALKSRRRDLLLQRRREPARTAIGLASIPSYIS